MSVSADKLAMQKAIMDYIDSRIPKDKNKAQIGTIKNNRVVIGNNSYGYVPGVDLYFGEGSRVACLQPEQTNSAVVVGVLQCFSGHS